MALTDEEVAALAVHVKSYAQDRIDAQVRREMRWIHYLAGTLGVANVAALVALFFVLPSMAAGRLLSDLTHLDSQVGGIVTKVGAAQTAAEEATIAAQGARKAADAAKQAAAVIDSAGVSALAPKIAALNDLFSIVSPATQLVDLTVQQKHTAELQASMIAKLELRAHLVDRALDQIGQAEAGGVWQFIDSFLTHNGRVEPPPSLRNDWATYATSMQSVYKDAQTRLRSE